MQRKKSIKINIHTQKQLKFLKRNVVGSGKIMCIQLRKMTGSNVRDAETDFISSVLHTNRNASTAVEGFCRRKPSRMQKII